MIQKSNKDAVFEGGRLGSQSQYVKDLRYTSREQARAQMDLNVQRTDNPTMERLQLKDCQDKSQDINHSSLSVPGHSFISMFY